MIAPYLEIFNDKDPGAAKPQSLFHRRGTEFKEIGVFLIKISLLRALRASAVSSPLDQCKPEIYGT
jgi:hypothetical protein